MQKCKEYDMLTVVTTAYALLVNLDVFSIHYFGLKKMCRVFLLLLQYTFMYFLTCIQYMFKSDLGSFIYIF